ncbi:MAG: M50 family metallopeptidase [Alphaproteobacteria bacterium]
MQHSLSPEALWFIGLVVGSFLTGETPLRLPFRWAETYYHELSHGLAALISGGRVHRIQLHFDGSGLCTTAGGSRVLILLAGYMGAALWGSLLYVGGWAMGETGSGVILQIELALLAVTTLLWVRDIKTLIILGIVASVYATVLLYGPSTYLPYLLQFTGIYVLMNALRAPLHLIDGQHVGDGAALANIFKVLPEIFWIVWWLVFALVCLAVCAWVTMPEVAIYTSKAIPKF